jgi:Fumarate reductase flavoprotein C-term
MRPGMVLLVVAALLLAPLGLLWAFQRRLIYFPSPGPVPPAATVLPGAAEVSFPTADGLRLQGWFVPPTPVDGRPPVPGRWATLPEGAPLAVGEAQGRPGMGASEVRGRLRRVMTDRVGVVRSGAGLAEAMAELERLALDLEPPGARSPGGEPPGTYRFEVANLIQLGRAVAELAIRREESRGGHWRSDHPEPVEAWRVRQTLVRSEAGELRTGVLAVREGAVAEVGCP